MRTPSVAVVAPSLDILGGQSVQAQALVEGLRRDGCEASLLPINPRFPRGARWVRRLPYARTLVNQALYLPSLLRLRGADVVHVFSASYWSFLLAPVPAMLAARALGRHPVLNYHSDEAEDHLARWGGLVHPWLRLAAAIVVPSRYLQATFARHGYSARVIRNVVDTARFRYRARSPLRPRLVTTRNLEPYYRVDVTLEAFAMLKSRFPDATLVVAGGGREEARLRRLAEGLGVGGIRFLGPVPPAAMPALLDSADIFVNASVVDNQPVSVLEAFSAGLPVVSTGTGDLASMVEDGETGLVVPREDPSALAKAVETLLDNPEQAGRLAARAREQVEEYTWARVGPAWASLYTEVLA